MRTLSDKNLGIIPNKFSNWTENQSFVNKYCYKR